MFSVSVASKELRLAVSGLKSTLADYLIGVDSKDGWRRSFAFPDRLDTVQFPLQNKAFDTYWASEFWPNTELLAGGRLRFYTKEECETWLSDRQRQKPDLMPDVRVERIDYPPEPYRVFFFAHWIASELTYRRPTLLFMTEWGVWSGSENWHLYYKLRQTYADNRLLHEAPGHLFLEHEDEDLASFLQQSMLNGWGGYVLTEANYVNAFFSHDEYIDFFAQNSGNLAEIRKMLGTSQSAADGR